MLKLLFFILLGTGCSTGFAAPAETLVQRYFRDLTSLRAEFVQQVFDERSEIIQQSSGRVYMQKPRRFRWDYREPYRQIIVADGRRLWLYDSELEQVTVRQLDEALTAAPLALLSGAAPIDEAFAIGESYTRDQLQWFELQPKTEQAEFKLLRVAFQGEALKILELEDVFNQRTRLQFDELERNPTIDPVLLRFVPPPGADVIGDIPR